MARLRFALFAIARLPPIGVFVDKCFPMTMNDLGPILNPAPRGDTAESGPVPYFSISFADIPSVSRRYNQTIL